MMKLIFLAALPLTHTLCHICVLSGQTYADLAEGLIFSKASPAVKAHSFSTESVLYQWSLSKAVTKPAA